MCLPKITQCRLRAKHTASSRSKVSNVDEWPHQKKKNKRPLLIKRDGNTVSVTESQKNKPSEEIHETANSDSKRSILLCLGERATKTKQSFSRRRTYEVQPSGKLDPTSPTHPIPHLDSEDGRQPAVCLHRTVHEGNFSVPSCCDVITHQRTCPHNYIRLSPRLPVQNPEYLTVSTAYADYTSDSATPASYIQEEEVDDFQLSTSLQSHRRNLYNTSASFIDSGWGSMSPIPSDLCTMGYPTTIGTHPIKRRVHRAERENTVAQDSFLGRFSKSDGYIMFPSEQCKSKGMKPLTEDHRQEISQLCGSNSKRSAYEAVHTVAEHSASPKDNGKSPSAADIREMSGPENLYPNSRSEDVMFEGVWRKPATDRGIAQQQTFSISVTVLKERDAGLPLPPLFVTNKLDNKSSDKARPPVSETKSGLSGTCPPVNIPGNEMCVQLCGTRLSEKFASVRPKPPDMSKRSVRRIKRDSVHSRLSDEFQESSEASSAPSLESDYVVTSNQDSVATVRYADLMYIDQNLEEQEYPVQNAMEMRGPSPIIKSQSMSALCLDEQRRQGYKASRMLEISTNEKQCNARNEAINIGLHVSPKYNAKASRRSYPLAHQVDELMAKFDGPMGKPGEKVSGNARSWMFTSTDRVESIGRNDDCAANFDQHVLKCGFSQVPRYIEGNTDEHKCTDKKNSLCNQRFSPVGSKNFGGDPVQTEELPSPTAIISEATTKASFLSFLSAKQFVEKFIEDDMAFFDRSGLLMHSTLVEDTSEFSSTMQETSTDACTQASVSASDFYVQELNNTVESGLCPNFPVYLDSEEQQPHVTSDQEMQSTPFIEGVSDSVDSRGDRKKSAKQGRIVFTELFPTTSAGSRDVGHDDDRRDEVDSGLDFSYSSCANHQSNSQSIETATGKSNSQCQVSIPLDPESIVRPNSQFPVTKADAHVIPTDHSPPIGAMLRTFCDTPGDLVRLNGNDVRPLKPVLSENPAHLVSEVPWHGSRMSDLETTKHDTTEDSGCSSLIVEGPKVSEAGLIMDNSPAYGAGQCEVPYKPIDHKTRVDLGVPSFLQFSPPAVQQKQSSPSHDQKTIQVSNSSNDAAYHDASRLPTPPEKSSVSKWQLLSTTEDDEAKNGVSVGSEFQSVGARFRNSPSPPETAGAKHANPELRKGTDELGLGNHQGTLITSSIDEEDDGNNTQWKLKMKGGVNDHPHPEIPEISSNQSEISKSAASNLGAPCGYTSHSSQHVMDSILESEPNGEYSSVNAFAHTTPTAKLRYIVHGLEVANQTAPHITEKALLEYQGQVASSTLGQSRKEAQEQRMKQETSDLVVDDESCDFSDNTSNEKVRMSRQITHTHELPKNDNLHEYLFFLDMQPQGSKYHDVKTDSSPTQLEPSRARLLHVNKAYQMTSEVMDSKRMLSPGSFRMTPTMQTMDQLPQDELECGKCKTPEIPKFAEGSCASNVDEKAKCELSNELHGQVNSVENNTDSYLYDAQPHGQMVHKNRQWWSTQSLQHGENETEIQKAVVLNENLPGLSEPPGNSIDQTVDLLFAFLGPSRVHNLIDEGLFRNVESFRPRDPRRTTLGINQHRTFFTEAVGPHYLPNVESGASSESEYHSKRADTLVWHNTESGFTGEIQDTTLKDGQQPPALSLLPAGLVGELQERTCFTEDRSSPDTASEHDAQWQRGQIMTSFQQNAVIPTNSTASAPRTSSSGSDEATSYGIQPSVNFPLFERPEITVILKEPEIIPTYITPKFSAPPKDLKAVLEVIQRTPLTEEASTSRLEPTIQREPSKETGPGFGVITRLSSYKSLPSQAVSVSTPSLDHSFQVTTSVTSSTAEDKQLCDNELFSEVQDISNDRNQSLTQNKDSNFQPTEPSELCSPKAASSTSPVKCQSPPRTLLARYRPPQSISDEELERRTEVLNEDISTLTASTQLPLMDRWTAWAFASLTSTFHFATIYLPRNVYWFYLATFESRDHLLRAMAGRSLNLAVTWSHIQAALYNPICVAGIFLGLTTLSPHIQQLPYSVLHLLSSSHLQPVPLWDSCRPTLSYVGHLILSFPTTLTTRRLLTFHSPFR